MPTELEWIPLIKNCGFEQLEIIKSRSIHEELEIMLNDEFLLEDSWKSAQIEDETLDYHNKLMVKFAEQLGYRVIKAEKVMLVN